MTHLKELLKKKHVANHPLIKVALAKKAERARLRKSIAQTYDGDLSDMFSRHMEDEEEGLDGGDQKLATFIYKASMVTQDLFNQFNFPLPPTLKYLNAYGVKRAATDEDRVVNAEIRLEAKIESQTGARRYLEVPVHIVRGMIVPPSIVYYEGRELLLTQGLVDNIIHTATAWALEPARENWTSPLIDRQDMAMYTDVRNERGYQPREYQDGFMTHKSSGRKRGQQLDPVAVFIERADSGEYGIQDDTDVKGAFEAMCKQVGGEYWDDNEVLHCIRVNPESQDLDVWWTQDDLWFGPDYDEEENPGEDNKRLAEDIYKGVIKPNGDMIGEDGEVFDAAEIPEDVINRAENAYSDPRQLKLFSSRRKAIKKGVPSGWDTVVELLETAREDGTDTFPRSYAYVLRHYVLEVLSTVDNNHWEIALVNAGYVINPYGRNRGRVTAKKTRAYLSFDGVENFGTVDILSTDDGTFEIKTDNVDNVIVIHNDKLLEPIYYGSGQVGWDYDVPQEVDMTVSERFEILERENSDAFDHLYTDDEKPSGTFQRAYSRAQAQAQALDDFELELELEMIDLPVEFADLDTGEEYDVELTAEDDQPQLLDWFYDGTKTPIEVNDSIKFEAHEGPIRAQIVELQEDNNCVIVKSKGTEYRVFVEDIIPMNNTFKKMYLATQQRRAQSMEHAFDSTAIISVGGDTDFELDNSPVYIAVIHDSSGFTPSSVVWIQQGWGNETDCLEEAFEELEDWSVNRLDEDELREREDGLEEGYDPVTEGFDGFAFTTTARELQTLIENIQNKYNKEKFSEIEFEEEENDSQAVFDEAHDQFKNMSGQDLADWLKGAGFAADVSEDWQELYDAAVGEYMTQRGYSRW